MSRGSAPPRRKWQWSTMTMIHTHDSPPRHHPPTSWRRHSCSISWSPYNSSSWRAERSRSPRWPHDGGAASTWHPGRSKWKLRPMRSIHCFGSCYNAQQGPSNVTFQNNESVCWVSHFSRFSCSERRTDNYFPMLYSSQSAFMLVSLE